MPTTDDRQPLHIMQMCAVDFTARQFLMPLAHALKEKGHQVSVACAAGPYREEIAAGGIQFVDNPIERSGNVLKHAAAIARTARLLRRERVDVLHVHTPVASLVGRVAAQIARVPVVIYTAHGFYFHDNTAPLKRKALVALEKAGAACGDFIMTVSGEDAEAAVREGISDRDKVQAIYNGVDAAHFDPSRFDELTRTNLRQSYDIPAGAPVIGMVGRMVREKGWFEFFSAATEVLKRFPEARFLAVGDVLPSDYDGGKNELKEFIRSQGLESRVVFTGLVADPAPALAIMDVFCLPSYREGMPISLLEAMAMGLPCIATNIRGCREEVVDGVTGTLVPVKDAPALADAVVNFLEQPETARRMGDSGRARILKDFTIAAVVERQLQIYDRLLKTNMGRDL